MVGSDIDCFATFFFWPITPSSRFLSSSVLIDRRPPFYTSMMTRIARRAFSYLFPLFILIPSSGLLAQPSSEAGRALAGGIDAILDAPAFENAWWGVVVVNLTTGVRLYQRNEGRSFIPASNTKLYTTAATLDQLGPSFRYETTIFGDGPVEAGTLAGNLIIRGSGDPVIGGRFNEGDLNETFRDWAKALRTAGITTIAGDLIGDDDLFDDTALGYGWSWDDVPFWYSAEIGALSFNDNCVDFSIQGQQAGMPGVISWTPDNTDYVSVRNSTLTVHQDSSLVEGYVRSAEGNRFTLSSRVPAGKVDLESLAVTNPTLYFLHVLRATLVAQGIAVEGRIVDVDDLSIKPDYASSKVHPLAVHLGPPLQDIVKVINKQSQNLYAEQLLKTLAAHRPVDDPDLVPGSAAMGVAAVMKTLSLAGVDTSRIQLTDGSGLSRMNLVTPGMTAALLTYMWNHPSTEVRRAFLASLPVGGLDGTLRYRFTDGPARGNVRAKTGTVSNASALSGYLSSATGAPLAFVLMSNHYTGPTSEIRSAQDAVVNILANYR